MKCNNCGQEILDNTKYCPRCGNQINNNDDLEKTIVNNYYLVMGLMLLFAFPVVGILFCVLMKNNDTRLEKVLKYYLIGMSSLILIVALVFMLIVKPAIASNSKDAQCEEYCNSKYEINGNICICSDDRTLLVN